MNPIRMMIAVSLLALSACGNDPALEESIEALGEAAVVPEDFHATVMNADGIMSKFGEMIEVGGDCAVLYGGTLTQVEVNSETLLVRYGSSDYFTGCPNGTLLLVEKDDFATMTERYEVIEAKKKALIEEVEAAVTASTAEIGVLKYGKIETGAVYADQSVTILNPRGKRNQNGHFDFYEECTIKIGDQLILIGEISDGSLVKYTVNHPTYGTICPNGTLFVVESYRFDAMNRNFQAIEGQRRQFMQEVSEAIEVFERFEVDESQEMSVLREHEVTVVNPHPISNRNSSFQFEDLCRVTLLGKLVVIDEVSSGTLVEYVISYNTGGNSCPSGTLFVIEDDSEIKSSD